MTDRHESHDALAATIALIALISDHKGCAKRLAELQQQIEVAAKAQAKLDADRGQHERAAAADKASADEREKTLRAREVAVAIKERDLLERARAITASKPDRYPPDPNFHGTIRQEPYTNG